jgi:predicted GIY-YIG superfamily endonuclease
MWSVYLLQEEGGSRTYVGATVDIHRRLRQHNGEISGGAKATSGKDWKRVCYVTGFPHERGALQFEWAWKYRSRGKSGNPLERRNAALEELLVCDKPTSKAIDYLEYRESLQVVWENAPLMLAGSNLPLAPTDSGATIADTATSEGQ